MAAAYPNLMTHSVVGQSYEGNNMNFVKISTGGTGKKAIFVDGGKIQPNNCKLQLKDYSILKRNVPLKRYPRSRMDFTGLRHLVDP